MTAPERVRWSTADELDDAVDAWHEGAGGGAPLHVYLGLSWEQYAVWVESGALPANKTGCGTMNADVKVSTLRVESLLYVAADGTVTIGSNVHAEAVWATSPTGERVPTVRLTQPRGDGAISCEVRQGVTVTFAGGLVRVYDEVVRLTGVDPSALLGAGGSGLSVSGGRLA